MPRHTILIALLAAALAGGCGGEDEDVGGETPAPRGPSSTYHLAPDGDDSDPGTSRRPWRSLDHALEELRPGDRVLLAAGTYGERGTKTDVESGGAPGAPITITGAPGEPRPRVLGHVEVSADHVRLSRIDFDGPTGPVKPRVPDNPKGEQVLVAIEGDDVEIVDSIVRGGRWHAGIYLSDAERARVVGNCIEDNGDRDPAVAEFQANLSHGIYWSSGSGLIANNLIAGNVARGVQLYESPHDVTVAHNTIVGNGRAGIQFGADTADSVAVGNVVAFNGDTGVRTASLDGSGNRARENLAWANAGGDFEADDDGLELEGNLVADPRFVDPPADWRPGPASPALDRVPGAPPLPRDIAGLSRPQGRGSDLGAYERPTSGERRSRPVC